MDARLALRNVRTGYRQFSISNVNLELKGGDIFGLIGRSGSGKSTLLNTITGAVSPSYGTIDKSDDAIGYSPQKNALYPYLTIEENLLTFGELHGIPRSELEQRIDKLLKRLDLEQHRKKLVMELSGGMEKRTDLAVTLVHDPIIIILDEPFNGLDISIQQFIWELLRELASQGKIIVITSHLLDDIQKYCTKIGLVENGAFYGNEDIQAALQKQKGASLQSFLEQLFRRDFLMENQKRGKK